MKRRALVIGMGNDYRRDDGVGPVVARGVAARLGAVGGDLAGDPAGDLAGDLDGDAVEVVDGVPDPLDLLGRWEGAPLVVVVDAIRSEAPAGTVSVVELPLGAPPARSGRPADAPPGPGDRGGASASTHGIGVVAVLQLARAVGQAPERVVLVGVTGADFGRGQGLGPAVADAVPDAVERVVALVTGAARHPG